MSAITEYLDDIERLLDNIPFRLSTKIHVENRGDIALYIRGEVEFVNGSKLHFKEYFIAIPVLKKLAYSYHYQNKEEEIIFRFDNAEHHPEIKTYPHHKHSKDSVSPSKEMLLKEAITEALNILIKLIKK